MDIRNESQEHSEKIKQMKYQIIIYVGGVLGVAVVGMIGLINFFAALILVPLALSFGIYKFAGWCGVYYKFLMIFKYAIISELIILSVMAILNFKSMRANISVLMVIFIMPLITVFLLNKKQHEVLP